VGEQKAGGSGPLVDWLAERGLLLGPFLYIYYWASVLGLQPGARAEHVARGWVDLPLFRGGVHRPDLELPRLRYYAAFLLIGPLLLPFRAVRRLGRYPIHHRRQVGDELSARLKRLELEMRQRAAGRVDVCIDGQVIASDVIDPCRNAAFSSLFYATYKLPFATVTAIVAMAVAGPLLSRFGLLDRAMDLWVPVVLPAVAALLYLLYRDVATAILGTVPVLIGWLLLLALGGRAPTDWGLFFGALALLLTFALLADWFFVPRPVPPSLYLYTREGEGRAFDREEDAPYWLEGESYWVWRYLMLVPAELNKFWERDWERAELWVRADGSDAGRLEWVVVDAHYRELWMPYERLGPPERLRRQRESARDTIDSGATGFWLVEVDMNLVFHTPFVRTVSFVPEGDAIPARSLWHLLSGLFRRGPRDDPSPYLSALDRVRLKLGDGVLSDVPEAIASLTARQILAVPWRFWRYPLGAQRRREPRIYGRRGVEGGLTRADRELQIKANSGEEGLP